MKIIFYLCVAEQSANILDESVFALSVTENVAIFSSKGQRTALIPCIDCCGRHALCLHPISISVWGIASFILLWVATTFC